MNPTKRKLIIGGVLVAVLIAVAVVNLVRSRQQTADYVDDLNSPERIAMDECLAKADDPLHDVFVAACLNDRSIDPDKEHCDRWGSKKVLEFMNKNANYPKFKEALAAWEKESLKCSEPASPTPQP